eukprot:m.14092 g.14092  ORF g.14092 m.14092 type:complete len:414 (+) comp4251_c0_seq1:66-1307(+)
MQRHLSRHEDNRQSVGFSGLTNQLYRRAKKGGEFNVMVAGEAGLGKSTLISTLFMDPAFKKGLNPPASKRVERTVAITPMSQTFKFGSIPMTVTVVDTPGFGDAVNNSNCWDVLVEYIDAKFRDHLQEEMSVQRQKKSDSLVHCLLYFINPSSNGLKPLDIAALQALHKKVNIVPVIAKSDTLTKPEVTILKQKIQRDIANNNISLFSPTEDDDDPSSAKAARKLVESLPFAVVGADGTVESGGKTVRGRKYGWGTVEIDNPDHCDFFLLKDMLVRTHLCDLREVTKDKHYENFRSGELRKNGGNASMSISALQQSITADANLDEEFSKLSSEKEKFLEEKRRQEREFQEKQKQLEEQMRMLREQQKLLELAQQQTQPQGDQEQPQQLASSQQQQSPSRPSALALQGVKGDTV